MSNITVDGETAEIEFARIAELVDADIDEATMSEEDLDSFKKMKRKITRAIEQGRLVVDGEGVPTLTTLDGKELTFKEPDGKVYLAMDRRKKNEDVGKTFQAIGALCGVPPTQIVALKQRDQRVVQALFALFLGG